ncbi:MAG: suppressor of fused domain protein [Kineosporiaceae bacterium]
MTSLIDHFERYLGPIHTGWSTDPDGAPMPFQIVKFTGGSDSDSVGYATLGLSRHLLTSPAGRRQIQQELFMLAPQSLTPDFVASLLLHVGTRAIKAKRALLRGDVVGPAGALVPDSKMTALYVTMPVYFPDEFATYSGGEGGVVIAWLVPIGMREVELVSRSGWPALEDKLAEQDPDLVDFHRAEMTL